MMDYLLLFVAVLLISKPKARIYCNSIPGRFRHGVCEFPSIYRDKVIHQCQLNSQGQWWCPKDENYDVYNQRSLCPNTSLTYAGSDPGQLCHFPFVYQGREHSACVRARDPISGAVYWWCATTSNYDTDRRKRWTRCWEHSNELPCFFKGEGGTGISAECRYFNDKWVCHTERSEIRECPRTQHTYAGNSPGQPCHFPFLYGQKEYRSCITTQRRRTKGGHPDQFEPYLWCATTANYNTDHLWTKCVVSDSSVSLANGRVIVPVSIVLIIVVAVLFLSTLVHFCCDHNHMLSHGHKHTHYIHQTQPAAHISMPDLSTRKPCAALVASAPPPSYLEAVSLGHDNHEPNTITHTHIGTPSMEEDQ